MIDVSLLHLTVEREIHCLSHFSEIDSAYKHHLISVSGLSKEEIQKYLDTPGGKFNPSFSTNPRSLFKKLQESIMNHEVQPYFRQNSIRLFFHTDQFHEGIGYDSIIHIDLLPPDRVPEISFEPRKNFSVKCIRNYLPKPTWEVNIIVSNLDSTQIQTIFPGVFAPSLPDPGWQSDNELELSRKFWDTHVFITQVSGLM